METKSMIFPPGYDAAKVFWLVNNYGTFGARSEVLPLIKEIVVGMVIGDKLNDLIAECKLQRQQCIFCTPSSVFKKLATTFSHGAWFPFTHD
jgi:hypothetical protein